MITMIKIFPIVLKTHPGNDCIHDGVKLMASSYLERCGEDKIRLKSLSIWVKDIRV